MIGWLVARVALGADPGGIVSELDVPPGVQVAVTAEDGIWRFVVDAGRTRTLDVPSPDTPEERAAVVALVESLLQDLRAGTAPDHVVVPAVVSAPDPVPAAALASSPPDRAPAVPTSWGSTGSQPRNPGRRPAPKPDTKPSPEPGPPELMPLPTRTTASGAAEAAVDPPTAPETPTPTLLPFASRSRGAAPASAPPERAPAADAPSTFAPSPAASATTAASSPPVVQPTPSVRETPVPSVPERASNPPVVPVAPLEIPAADPPAGIVAPTVPSVDAPPADEPPTAVGPSDAGFRLPFRAVPWVLLDAALRPGAGMGVGASAGVAVPVGRRFLAGFGTSLHPPRLLDIAPDATVAEATFELEAGMQPTEWLRVRGGGGVAVREYTQFGGAVGRSVNPRVSTTAEVCWRQGAWGLTVGSAVDVDLGRTVFYDGDNEVSMFPITARPVVRVELHRREYLFRTPEGGADMGVPGTRRE